MECFDVLKRLNDAVAVGLDNAVKAYVSCDEKEFELWLQRVATTYDTLKRVKSLVKALDAIDETNKAKSAE